LYPLPIGDFSTAYYEFKMLGNDKYVFILSFFLYAAKLTFFDVFLGLVYFATAQRCMDLTTRCREWVEIRLDIVAMA
jgi:hypothetical protein